ncbi:arginase family protein [Limosilactobacillus fermentum]|uniref:arginase family protein n=1 Tax=Limosilactobacillus fermentum TaxID=1613 RepID=UPI002F2698D3
MQPDKVLMVGGDCAVSLAPFDYLSGRYGRDLGVVWLDTHPDISTTEESHHLHEMVVSSLLGKGAPGFNAHHPLASDQVILAGLIEEDPAADGPQRFRLPGPTADAQAAARNSKRP